MSNTRFDFFLIAFCFFVCNLFSPILMSFNKWSVWMGRCGEYIHSPENLSLSLIDFQNEPGFILVSYEASVTAVIKLLKSTNELVTCVMLRRWSVTDPLLSFWVRRSEMPKLVYQVFLLSLCVYKQCRKLYKSSLLSSSFQYQIILLVTNFLFCVFINVLSWP